MRIMDSYFSEKQNIFLLYGDNAVGKTRLLIKSMIYESEEKNYIVTNIPRYTKAYTRDKEKMEVLNKTDNILYNRVMENEPDDAYDACIKNKINIICAKGDILVLDEVDHLVETQDIIWLATLISDVRKLWKRIYLVANSWFFTRVFTDISI